MRWCAAAVAWEATSRGRSGPPAAAAATAGSSFVVPLALCPAPKSHAAAPKLPLIHAKRTSMAALRYAALLAGVAMLASTSSALTPSTELARGWGDNIAWVENAVARKIAKKSGRPVMYVIHKTWCGACKNLKPKFAASEEIAKLSAEFVMVNLQDNEEPAGDQFKPDGGYIPRILFAGPSGRVDPSVINSAGNPKYKYFYSDADSIVASMKSALASLAPAKDEL